MLRTCGLALLAVLFTACSSEPPRDPAIGEAFAGPAELRLREEISPRSKTAAIVKHGERLEIIRQRRRFYRVRTAAGTEGWTDERMLLSAEEVRTLSKLAEETKTAPSQAVATVFDDLNVHTEPYRTAPSFYQIKAGEHVDVIARRAIRRGAKTSRRILPAAVPSTRKPTRKGAKKKEPKLPPVPMPKAPKPPSDWLELSQRQPMPEPPAGAPSRDAAPETEPLDDWSLIRSRNGATGWVLSRRLFMAIPDEVAQYAEGHRIRAYFPLGEVKDGAETKKNWLWATVQRGDREYDFDSIRLFRYNPRRHRYETSYIERNLQGYYPILLHSVNEPASLAGKGAGGKLPGFSIVIDKKDGSRVRRSYAMWDTRVRLAGEEPVAAGQEPGGADSRPPLVTGASQPATGSWLQQKWRALRERWSR